MRDREREGGGREEGGKEVPKEATAVATQTIVI